MKFHRPKSNVRDELDDVKSKKTHANYTLDDFNSDKADVNDNASSGKPEFHAKIV